MMLSCEILKTFLIHLAILKLVLSVDTKKTLSRKCRNEVLLNSLLDSHAKKWKGVSMYKYDECRTDYDNEVNSMLNVVPLMERDNSKSKRYHNGAQDIIFTDRAVRDGRNIISDKLVNDSAENRDSSSEEDDSSTESVEIGVTTTTSSKKNDNVSSSDQSDSDEYDYEMPSVPTMKVYHAIINQRKRPYKRRPVQRTTVPTPIEDFSLVTIVSSTKHKSRTPHEVTQFIKEHSDLTDKNRIQRHPTINLRKVKNIIFEVNSGTRETSTTPKNEKITRTNHRNNATANYSRTNITKTRPITKKNNLQPGDDIKIDIAAQNINTRPKNEIKILKNAVPIFNDEKNIVPKHPVFKTKYESSVSRLEPHTFMNTITKTPYAVIELTENTKTTEENTTPIVVIINKTKPKQMTRTTLPIMTTTELTATPEEVYTARPVVSNIHRQDTVGKNTLKHDIAMSEGNGGSVWKLMESYDDISEVMGSVDEDTMQHSEKLFRNYNDVVVQTDEDREVKFYGYVPIKHFSDMEPPRKYKEHFQRRKQPANRKVHVEKKRKKSKKSKGKSKKSKSKKSKSRKMIPIPAQEEAVYKKPSASKPSNVFHPKPMLGEYKEDEGEANGEIEEPKRRNHDRIFQSKDNENDSEGEKEEPKTRNRGRTSHKESEDEANGEKTKYRGRTSHKETDDDANGEKIRNRVRTSHKETDDETDGEKEITKAYQGLSSMEPDDETNGEKDNEEEMPRNRDQDKESREGDSKEEPKRKHNDQDTQLKETDEESNGEKDDLRELSTTEKTVLVGGRKTNYLTDSDNAWDAPYLGRRKMPNTMQYASKSAIATRKPPVVESVVTSVADDLAKEIRILCWVMTSSEHHETRAESVRRTWGRRCTVLIFFSDTNHDTLPAIKAPVPKGEKYHWGLTKEAFRYVYTRHWHDADWFLKADDDTYVILENLRYLLSNYSPNLPLYLGKRFKPYVNQGFMSGGAGYVLSREALRRLVNIGLDRPDLCLDGIEGSADVEMGKCLSSLAVEAVDTRDTMLRERFMPFLPQHHLFPEKNQSYWYWNYAYYPVREGFDCCSDYPVSFHYADPETMMVLEYFLYHTRVYGFEKKHKKITKV